MNRVIVCDVVKNSIWYDPRVKKQIQSYINNGYELFCVGLKDIRYNEAEVRKIPCSVKIVDIDHKYYSEKRNFFTKVIREIKINKRTSKAIIDIKPEIIHANDLDSLIPAYKAAKKLKCKLIYDTHEIFLENPWIAGNKLVKCVWSLFEKYLITKVDAVVCVSYAAAEYFAKKYKISEPLVVTNCISSDRHIKDMPQKAEPKQILNHGQFYGGRGYDIMIEAAPRLKEYSDIQLVLRGFGSLEQQLKDRVKELDAENVCFAPPVKVEELIPCASIAYIGLAITEPISINFKLSVSNKIFEYAAAGLPVIMSDIPEHRYLNEKYNFGIVLEENTPECFAEAAIKLYTDKEFYDMCAENADRLSKEINWETEFSRLIEIERSWVNG